MAIEVVENHQLKWPDGWERTPIGSRKSQASWKKPFVIAVLLRQGLLVDNGGQLSLKEL